MGCRNFYVLTGGPEWKHNVRSAGRVTVIVTHARRLACLTQLRDSRAANA